VTDLGKYGVIAAIMGAILLMGVVFYTAPSTDQQATVAPTVVATLPSLEMLDPVYSEKGVFQDDTIRIAFDVSFVDDRAESRLQFWLNNVSDDAITILWDRCSIQLPDGNTVQVLSEGSLDDFIPLGRVITVAPGGDLFDAAVPITEISSDGAGGWSLTRGILDSGAFTFVLAIERGVPCPTGLNADRIRRQIQADGCDGATKAIGRAFLEHALNRREIVYYTFRFVIR